MTHACAMLAFFAGAMVGELPPDYQLPPTPGVYVAADSGKEAGRVRFRAGEPVVATTYFYWYDDATKAHLIDHDGTDALTDHPTTLDGFSYNNVDWHARQLTDMMAAGIDVALPVYWGFPGCGPEHWSDRGLPKLVAARERLLAEGKSPPAIGMFYDTTTLAHNDHHGPIDLTTSAGRRWFYGTVRDFFSRIPPEHRARIDGRPLVLLYASAFAKRVDDKLFPAVREMFCADFGTDMYLVKMRDWPGPADSEYQWGAAIAPQILDTAAVGPGYDHSAVPGRAPLVRRRDEGRFYRFGWQRLLSMDPARRPWLVHVETWNEFHEGTDICASREYGRKYIELTREFADLFHGRKRVEAARGIDSPREVSASPGQSKGIEQVAQPGGDGPIVEKTVDGKRAWMTTVNRHSPETRYMYFDADYSFLYNGDATVEVTVGYFDAGLARFELQYDSSDPSLAGLAQQFRGGGSRTIRQSKTWKEAVFVIPHARFAGGANGCDFRLCCSGDDLAVSHVRVRRVAK